jgi:hypothetical protein
MAPPDYLRLNAKLLYDDRLHNHEFDSKRMDDFSERLGVVETKQTEIHNDVQGVKESIGQLLMLFKKHFSV